MTTRITFLVIGKYGWGRGTSKAQAKRICIQAGGSEPFKTFRITDDGQGALPHVDAMGRCFAREGAQIEELRDGKFQPMEETCIAQEPGKSLWDCKCSECRSYQREASQEGESVKQRRDSLVGLILIPIIIVILLTLI